MRRRCSIIVQQAQQRRVWVLRAVASPRIGPSASSRVPEYPLDLLGFLMYASASSLHGVCADFAHLLTYLRSSQRLFARYLQHLRLAHMLPPCGKQDPEALHHVRKRRDNVCMISLLLIWVGGSSRRTLLRDDSLVNQASML